MRMIFGLFVGAMLITAGCVQQGPAEKALTLVNAAGVDAELVETLCQYMEKELHVAVRSVESPKRSGKSDFQTLEKAALRAKHENDVAYIVLADVSATEDLVVDAENGLAIINIQPFQTSDTELFARRMKRMVMRAAAFSFGLEPTPDPFCATRDYSSLEDFDRMGLNFSPPWQGRYAKEAAERGLEPLKPAMPPSLKKP